MLGGGAPVYERGVAEAAYFQKTRTTSIFSPARHHSYSAKPLEDSSSPPVASKRWVYEQYDTEVGTNTVMRANADAAVIRLKELPGKAVALTTDYNMPLCLSQSVYGWRDSRSRSCTECGVYRSGTRCYYKLLELWQSVQSHTEVYWQFREALRGMGMRCGRSEHP